MYISSSHYTSQIVCDLKGASHTQRKKRKIKCHNTQKHNPIKLLAKRVILYWTPWKTVAISYYQG